MTDEGKGRRRRRTTLARMRSLGGLGALAACLACTTGQAAEKQAPASGTAVAQAKRDSGSETFRARCSACHQATTTNAGVGPGLKGLFRRERLPRLGLPATEGNVRKVILEGSGAMPPFRQLLTDEAVDDLITYLKTL